MYFDKKGDCYDNGRNSNFYDDTNDPQRMLVIHEN